MTEANQCIHRKVCRYATVMPDCRCLDGMVETMTAVGPVYDRCPDYMRERTCRAVLAEEKSWPTAALSCSECGSLLEGARYCPQCGARVFDVRGALRKAMDALPNAPKTLEEA